jgi:hypothetical protein
MPYKVMHIKNYETNPRSAAVETRRCPFWCSLYRRQTPQMQLAFTTKRTQGWTLVPVYGNGETALFP